MPIQAIRLRSGTRIVYLTVPEWASTDRLFRVALPCRPVNARKKDLRIALRHTRPGSPGGPNAPLGTSFVHSLALESQAPRAIRGQHWVEEGPFSQLLPRCACLNADYCASCASWKLTVREGEQSGCLNQRISAFTHCQLPFITKSTRQTCTGPLNCPTVRNHVPTPAATCRVKHPVAKKVRRYLQSNVVRENDVTQTSTDWRTFTTLPALDVKKSV